MVDKVQKELQSLAIDMQTDHWGKGFSILALLSKPPSKDAEFARRITNFVQENGAEALNTPVDNHNTLLDIAQNLKTSLELTDPFAERKTRFPQATKIMGLTPNNIL
ncbi:MAG: hypothetical protein P8P30_06525 [Rickettsiales bacterium]|nr:hypothetical protein [Rickettsiales bacterium]